MALVLALVFRSRLRLLPLAVALAAVAITFGADGAARRAADDGLDRRAAGAARARRSTTRSSTRRAWRRRAATRRAAARVGGADDRHRGAGDRRRLPRAAALAGADGARLRRAAGGRHRDRVRARAHRGHRGAGRCAARRRGATARSRARLRGAGELVDERGARASRVLRRAGCGGSAGARAGDARALRRPGRVLAVGLVLARGRLGGRLADRGRLRRRASSCRRTCPRVRDLDALQKATGVAGEIDVVVEGKDLTDPKVVALDARLPAGLLKRYGYSAEERLRQGRAVPGAVAARPVPRRVARPTQRAASAALLDAVPPYFSQAVITADRKTANLAFGIRLMPLDAPAAGHRRHARAAAIRRRA